MKNIIFILLIITSLMADKTEQTTFEKFTFKPETPLTSEELKDRVLYTNLIGGAVVAAWGVAFWDYFTISPVMGDEGWFEEDTKYGGADKLGHLYSTYLWSLAFASIYEYWGMEEEDSMIYGPMTSWIFQGLMEVGDSFSESQGFSYEDMIANTIGAGFYYLREKYPPLKEKVDLRLEYLPNFRSEGDIFTKYDSMKYLVAVKFSGFESINDSFLKYGELQLGYYTRGYENEIDYPQKERIGYVGIGINVAEVLKEIGWLKTSKIFNYYQLPYTYIPFEHDYNSNSYIPPYSRGR